MTWSLAEAKNRFDKVVNLALTEGPQTITVGTMRWSSSRLRGMRS